MFTFDHTSAHTATPKGSACRKTSNVICVHSIPRSTAQRRIVAHTVAAQSSINRCFEGGETTTRNICEVTRRMLPHLRPPALPSRLLLAQHKCAFKLRQNHKLQTAHIVHRGVRRSLASFTLTLFLLLGRLFQDYWVHYKPRGFDV